MLAKWNKDSKSCIRINFWYTIFFSPNFSAFVCSKCICSNYICSNCKKATGSSTADSLCSGGGGGIRTHGTREGSAVFKTATLNHSDTSP